MHGTVNSERRQIMVHACSTLNFQFNNLHSEENAHYDKLFNYS
jgi:hypothetical protein